ncbi:hypothetical protein HWV62_75 [Athelia sp. TMB]|nr:hypothetical protein HWV62_75 [Athelia sp. TMB]
MAHPIEDDMATIADTPPVTDAGPPFDDAGADLILRSSDSVDFKVHKLLLSMGSPFFKDMFALPQGHGGETGDGLPVVPVSGTARTWEMLLAMCYPMGVVEQPALNRVEDVNALLDAAVKYSLVAVEKRLREALIAPQLLQDSAFRVFAVACRHKMVSEARAAARATLEKAIVDIPLDPELDLVSVTNFLRLLKYHKACTDAARDAIGSPPGAASNGPLAPVTILCGRCERLRSFAPVEGTVNTAGHLPIVDSIPSPEEIEKPYGYCAFTCDACGWQIFVQVSSNRAFAASYRAKLEDVISTVPLDLEL